MKGDAARTKQGAAESVRGSRKGTTEADDASSDASKRTRSSGRASSSISVSSSRRRPTAEEVSSLYSGDEYRDIVSLSRSSDNDDDEGESDSDTTDVESRCQVGASQLRAADQEPQPADSWWARFASPDALFRSSLSKGKLIEARSGSRRFIGAPASVPEFKLDYEFLSEGKNPKVLSRDKEEEKRHRKLQGMYYEATRALFTLLAQLPEEEELREAALRVVTLQAHALSEHTATRKQLVVNPELAKLLAERRNETSNSLFTDEDLERLKESADRRVAVREINPHGKPASKTQGHKPRGSSASGKSASTFGKGKVPRFDPINRGARPNGRPRQSKSGKGEAAGRGKRSQSK